MSNDNAKGRADTGAGKYDPPKDPVGGMLSSQEQAKETAGRKAEYDEGRHDKLREMEKEK